MSSPTRIDRSGRVDLPPPRRTLLRRLTAWLEQARALRGGIEAGRDRHASLDATFEVVERDSQMGGGMIAGALAYRLFVFALPLAFFLISGLGLLADALGRKPDLIVDSVGLAGVVTKQVASASDGASSWWVALTSFLVLVYATRMLLRAVAIVHALAWERSAAAVRVTVHSLAVFGAALATQLALVGCVGAVGHRSTIGGIVAFVLFVVALAAIWLVISLQVPHLQARWTDLILGSLCYAVGVIAIMLFNVLLLDRLLHEKATTYGALGIAATLLLAFFFAGRVIVLAAVLNATLWERKTRSRAGGEAT